MPLIEQLHKLQCKVPTSMNEKLKDVVQRVFRRNTSAAIRAALDLLFVTHAPAPAPLTPMEAGTTKKKWQHKTGKPPKASSKAVSSKSRWRSARSTKKRPNGSSHTRSRPTSVKLRIKSKRPQKKSK